jgi:MFS family permease
LELRKPQLQPRGKRFALALASIALIGPLCVHVFLPVIPAVKASFGISEALAQLTFSVTLLGMAFATLLYGSLADRYAKVRPNQDELREKFLIAMSMMGDARFRMSEPYQSDANGVVSEHGGGPDRFYRIMVVR